MGWFESLSGAVSGAVNTVASTASNVVSGAVSTAGNIASTAGNVVSGAISTGSNIASSAAKAVTSAPSTISNAVSSYISPSSSSSSKSTSQSYSSTPSYSSSSSSSQSLPSPYVSTYTPSTSQSYSSTPSYSSSSSSSQSLPSPYVSTYTPSTQSSNPISNIIDSVVQTQSNINKAAISTVQSFINPTNNIQSDHIEQQLNKSSPIPSAVVPSNLNRQIGNTGVYIKDIISVTHDNSNIIPGTYKSEITTTPSSPTPLNFLANVGGSVYNEVAGLAGITGISLPKAKTDYGFGSTTTTTSYDKYNYDITTLPKPLSKGGADYTSKLVSSIPTGTKTITETSTIKEVSVYEKMNEDFSKELKSTLPTIEKPVDIKNGGILGGLSNYGNEYAYGFYENGVKERPLDVVKYGAEGVMLAAAAPYIGTYLELATAGTRLAPVVTTLSELSPTILKAAVGYGVTKESTSGFTDFSPKAAEKAGEISGVQLFPMIVGAESYSRMGGVGRVSSSEVTSEYNLGIVSKGKPPSGGSGGEGYKPEVNIEGQMVFGKEKNVAYNPLKDIGEGYKANRGEVKTIDLTKLELPIRESVATSKGEVKIIDLTNINKPTTTEPRISASEINARNALTSDILVTKLSPKQSFEVNTENFLAIKKIAEQKGYDTNIPITNMITSYIEFKESRISAAEINARNALKNDITVTKLSQPSKIDTIITEPKLSIGEINASSALKSDIASTKIVGNRNLEINTFIDTMVKSKAESMNLIKPFENKGYIPQSQLQPEILKPTQQVKTITLEKPKPTELNIKNFEEYQKTQSKPSKSSSQSIQGRSESGQISLMEEKGIKTIDIRPVIDLRETMDLTKLKKSPFESGRDIIGEMKVSEQLRSSGKNIFGYSDNKISTMYINKLKTDSSIFNKVDTGIKTTQVIKTIPDTLIDTSLKEEKKTALYVNPFTSLKEDLKTSIDTITDTKVIQRTETIQSPFTIVRPITDTITDTKTDMLTKTETITKTVPQTDTGIIPFIPIPTVGVPALGLPSMDIGGGPGQFRRFAPNRFTEIFKVGEGIKFDGNINIKKIGKKLK
jgi:hypothetical protein